MKKRRISLIDLYEEKKQEKQISPARQLVNDLMAMTGRSEMAVRSWLSGKCKPEPLFQQIIADKLQIEVDALFPNKES